jgi:hypothetical protein
MLGHGGSLPSAGTVSGRPALPRGASSLFDNRRNYCAYLFGRLKPGVTLEEARTALNEQRRGRGCIGGRMPPYLRKAAPRKFNPRRDAVGRRIGTGS